MIQRLNPDTVPKPASAYDQAILHTGNARRLVISGQVGMTTDGKVLDGLEAQLRQCWLNLFAVMKAAGFEKRCLVKSVIYVTQPGQIALSRRIRDEMMEGHTSASTYLEIAGLASPQFLCEIEGEAVLEA
ncbi:MAG: RidA family protein [Rhizobiales bacterium]|nr:RidA family protein [Hyphomicrobiales bacterium]